MAFEKLWSRLKGSAGAGSIRIHLLIKGRIGDGWHDVDRKFRLPADSTLADLFDHVEGKGIDIRRLIAESPHLSDTLMLNGERCPVTGNQDRVLSDGDQVYLLAPVAGG